MQRRMFYLKNDGNNWQMKGCRSTYMTPRQPAFRCYVASDKMRRRSSERGMLSMQRPTGPRIARRCEHAEQVYSGDAARFQSDAGLGAFGGSSQSSESCL